MWRLLALGLALACVSCGGDDDGGGRDRDTGTGGDECIESRNCPFGFVCDDGFCVPAGARDGGADGSVSDGGADDGSTADGSTGRDGSTDGSTGADGSTDGSVGRDGSVILDGAVDAGEFDAGMILESSFDYPVFRGGSVTVYEVLVNELSMRDDVPVFLYLHAAGESHESPMARAWLEAMAGAGYLAASADYDDSPLVTCSALTSKARGIFSESEGGLLFDLCGMVGSVCDRGLVIVGHGQGGQLAMLARNYDSNVRGVLGLGVGYLMNGGSVDAKSCLDNTRTLTDNQLRIVNGLGDTTYGPIETPTFPFDADPGLRDQMEDLTLRTCSAPARECLRGDGSGWVFVRNSDVRDGSADHCYHSNGGCGGSPDANWNSTAAEWGFQAGRSWLMGLTPF